MKKPVSYRRRGDIDNSDVDPWKMNIVRGGKKNNTDYIDEINSEIKSEK